MPYFGPDSATPSPQFKLQLCVGAANPRGADRCARPAPPGPSAWQPACLCDGETRAAMCLMRLWERCRRAVRTNVCEPLRGRTPAATARQAAEDHECLGAPAAGAAQANAPTARSLVGFGRRSEVACRLKRPNLISTPSGDEEEEIGRLSLAWRCCITSSSNWHRPGLTLDKSPPQICDWPGCARGRDAALFASSL